MFCAMHLCDQSTDSYMAYQPVWDTPCFVRDCGAFDASTSSCNLQVDWASNSKHWLKPKES